MVGLIGWVVWSELGLVVVQAVGLASGWLGGWGWSEVWLGELWNWSVR